MKMRMMMMMMMIIIIMMMMRMMMLLLTMMMGGLGIEMRRKKMRGAVSSNRGPNTKGCFGK
eukprot:2055447-Pyramimonas_sp.AAC.1